MVLAATLTTAILLAASGVLAQAPASRPTTATATTAPASEPSEVACISMKFKDASLDTVLDYLSEVAGLVIVGDPKMEGRITIVSRQSVTVSEAVDLLDSALRENGYAAVRVGPRNLKIIPIDAAKKECIPVTRGADPDEIEPNDRIVTQVIPTRSADAMKLKADLAGLIPPSADIAANASSNMLIVTASQSVVRRVVQIVHAIDLETSQVSQVRRLPAQKRKRRQRGQADQ